MGRTRYIEWRALRTLALRCNIKIQGQVCGNFGGMDANIEVFKTVLDVGSGIRRRDGGSGLS